MIRYAYQVSRQISIRRTITRLFNREGNKCDPQDKLLNYLFFYLLHIYTESHELNKTNHLCKCFHNNNCASSDITCETARSETRWIGLRYFGFGSLQNETNCSSLGIYSYILLNKAKICYPDISLANSFTFIFNLLRRSTTNSIYTYYIYVLPQNGA